jgi:hypothetical protein
MTNNQQSACDLSEPKDDIRAELIIRLCTVLIRVKAQRDWLVWRTVIIQAALSGAQVDFQETGNPLHLLNGFVTARRAGVPVPEWVLQPLTAAIEMFLADKGEITLEDALRPDLKQGTRNIWTANENHQQDARLKWLFDQQLKAGLPLVSDKVGEPDAVEAVATMLGLNAEDIEKKRDSLRQTYHKRLKQHDSRLSR